jgi:hypothetical protein
MTVSGLNIDLTKPDLIGTATTAPNGNGWYNNDVVIHWTCSDALSGIADICPTDTLVNGEGDNLQASATISDQADNNTVTLVSPIKIDRTAPKTDSLAPSGWNNVSVNVSLVPHDALSGVANTSYSLDGGSTQNGENSLISGEGIHTLEYWSVDNASNEEIHQAAQIDIDLTPPTINYTLSPLANSNGWNNTDVTVSFACNDNLSGLTAGSPPADTILTTEGTNQSVTGICFDLAGNSASLSVDGINIDKTAPTLSPTVSPNTVPLNGSATVSANANDALSGIAYQSCEALDTTTAGTKTVSCTATDNAGNTSTASASYTVSSDSGFTFTGFFQPVDNLPTINQMKSGRGVQINFSLGGDQGLNIFAAGYPASQQIPCASNVPVDNIETTVVARSSSLSYDPLTDQYTYTWMTDKMWAKTCRELTFLFTDGTLRSAQFKFK